MKKRRKNPNAVALGMVRWLSPERGQAAGEPRKWPQGRLGQNPQEKSCRPAQRSTAATRTAQERVSGAVASVRARFGYCAIGLGADAIRYSARGLG